MTKDPNVFSLSGPIPGGYYIGSVTISRIFIRGMNFKEVVRLEKEKLLFGKISLIMFSSPSIYGPNAGRAVSSLSISIISCLKLSIFL